MYISKNKERELVRIYPNTENSDIARILKIPKWLVDKKAEELGLEKDNEDGWSKRDIESIIKHYPDKPNSYIAETVGKPKFIVEHQAFRLGLKKNNSYYSNISNTEEEQSLIRRWEEEYNHKEMNCSRGHYVLGEVLKYLYPHCSIEDEKPIGNLRLDWYIRELSTGFEVDGIQHVEHVEFFHETKYDFMRAQNRDYDKSVMCEKMGIGVVRFSHDEKITIGLVRGKIREVI